MRSVYSYVPLALIALALMAALATAIIMLVDDDASGTPASVRVCNAVIDLPDDVYGDYISAEQAGREIGILLERFPDSRTMRAAALASEAGAATPSYLEPPAVIRVSLRERGESGVFPVRYLDADTGEMIYSLSFNDDQNAALAGARVTQSARTANVWPYAVARDGTDEGFGAGLRWLEHPQSGIITKSVSSLITGGFVRTLVVSNCRSVMVIEITEISGEVTEQTVDDTGVLAEDRETFERFRTEVRVGS